MEKVLVSKNTQTINREQGQADLTLKLIEEVLEHYAAIEVELTDSELNALIRGSFSNNTISKLAAERYSDRPRRVREKLIEEFQEDVQSYTDVFTTAYTTLSPAVQVKDGKPFITPGAMEEIEERHSYYLTDPDSIQLYNQHRELVSQLNSLKEQLNARTGRNINTSYLVHFDAVGNAYAPPTNYGG